MSSAREDQAAEHVKCKRRSSSGACQVQEKIKQRSMSSEREDQAAEHVKRKRRSSSGACQVQEKIKQRSMSSARENHATEEEHGLLLCWPPPKPPETHVEDMKACDITTKKPKNALIQAAIYQRPANYVVFLESPCLPIQINVFVITCSDITV